VNLISHIDFISLFPQKQCRIIDHFTYTFYHRDKKPENFYEQLDLTEDEFYGSPISQGIVCRKL
jgi:hypothetical protein